MDDKSPINFIHQIIEEDKSIGKHEGKVQTRFPPEPNGYLHIGHAKSICLNFGTASKYGGLCNLRFDDTNPTTENIEYVESIKNDVRWLGFDWEDRMYYASDYFEQLFEYAVQLIKIGSAYICDLSAEETSANRGTPQIPGVESPYRSRSIEENLDLFFRMKEGEFPDGERVLKAKIDMASPNMQLRDPVIYRIKHAHHFRSGNKWCIYPMYDFAHGLSDSIEGVTHSLCTLEFEVHRPLYDWILEQLGVFHPQQIEFARLNLTYTVLSKRKLLKLVQENHVDSWDDPRLPTISGLRRRGYTADAIKNFAERIGIAKRDGIIDVALLEFSIREDLNKKAPRRLGVLDPIKLTIRNYPKGASEKVLAINNHEDENAGRREIDFSGDLYIDRADFMEDAPRKFFRLTVGREVRLRYGYYVTCVDFKKDPETGEVTEVICDYDPESKGGTTEDGRRVKGTIHWVSAAHAADAKIRMYDRLFDVEDPSSAENFLDHLNPNSLQVVSNAKVEASFKEAKNGEIFQFERKGYFILDEKDSAPDQLVFNRTVGLRDSWKKKK